MFKRCGKYCQSLCQCWFRGNMLPLFVVFFVLFLYFSFPQHKPTLYACGRTCICAYVCCEWEQGHCWGLGFLSEDLLQASLQHARDLEVGLHQRYFSYFTSIEPPASSHSCSQCRIGTDGPSYGGILVPFLRFTPWFEREKKNGLAVLVHLEPRVSKMWPLVLSNSCIKEKYGHCNYAFMQDFCFSCLLTSPRHDVRLSSISTDTMQNESRHVRSKFCVVIKRLPCWLSPIRILEPLLKLGATAVSAAPCWSTNTSSQFVTCLKYIFCDTLPILKCI